MLRQGLFSALVVFIVLQSYAAAMTYTPPREDGLRFDIDEPTGSIGTGDDAFNGFGFLAINGKLYQSPQTFSYVEDERTIYAPPVTMEFSSVGQGNKLIVTRRIYVPLESGKKYIRFYDLIENPTDLPQVRNVQFWGQMNRGATSLVERQEEDFAILGQTDNTGPKVGLVFRRGARKDCDFSFNLGQTSVVHLLTIPAHSSVALVHFVALQPPVPDQAQAKSGSTTQSGSLSVSAVSPDEQFAQTLSTLAAEPDYTYLSPEDVVLINNIFIDSDVNMDGRVNIIDLICVRNNLGKDPQTADLPRADVNADAKINIIDLICVRNDLGWPF